MLKRIGASIRNALSGQGSNVDMAGATDYCPRSELSPREIEDLMRVSMIRNVVECVPDDILRAWRVFDIEDQDPIFDIERKYKLGEKVHEALSMSKMYGGCLVLPEFMGNELMLQLPLMRSDKISGFRIIPQHLVTLSEDKEFYNINFAQGMKPVHKSRAYLLPGKKRYDYTTTFSTTTGLVLGQSEVDLVAEAFFNMMGSDQQLSHLMAKAIIDVRLQKGLTAEAERASRNPMLYAQLSQKQQFLAEATAFASNQQGIICDLDNEKVERLDVANGIGGLVVISNRYTDLFVAATTYPRTKILGEQVAGLNNDGGADLRRYYDRVEQYRSQKVWDLLRWMDGFIEKTEGITLPKWEFGNLWQMTDLEKIEYQLKVADRDAKYYDILGDAVIYQILDSVNKAGIYEPLKEEDIVNGEETA